MLKDRSSSRVAIVASILIAFVAVSVTATQSTKFSFIGSVQELLGYAPTNSSLKAVKDRNLKSKVTTPTLGVFAMAGTEPQPMVFSPDTSGLVISQIYGAGGNSGATYLNDFIELFNPTPGAISLNGYSIQYASTAGSELVVGNEFAECNDRTW